MSYIYINHLVVTNVKSEQCAYFFKTKHRCVGHKILKFWNFFLLHFKWLSSKEIFNSIRLSVFFFFFRLRTKICDPPHMIILDTACLINPFRRIQQPTAQIYLRVPAVSFMETAFHKFFVQGPISIVRVFFCCFCPTSRDHLTLLNYCHQ